MSSPASISRSLADFAEQIGEDLEGYSVDPLSGSSTGSYISLMDTSPHVSPRGRKRKLTFSSNGSSVTKRRVTISDIPKDVNKYSYSLHTVRFFRSLKPSICLAGATYIISGSGNGTMKHINMKSSSTSRMAKEIAFIRNDDTRETTTSISSGYFASVHVPKKMAKEMTKCTDKLMIFDTIIFLTTRAGPRVLPAVGIIVGNRLIYFAPEVVTNNVKTAITKATHKSMNSKYMPASISTFITPHLFKHGSREVKFLRSLYVVLNMTVGDTYSRALAKAKKAPASTLRMLADQYLAIARKKL
jgi:hypothetical protein